MSESLNIDRLPPHSLEAEQGVLGSILISPEPALEDSLEKLRPESFYDLRHRQIFAEMMTMYTEKTQVDPISLGQRLKDKHVLPPEVTDEYLGQLQDRVPSAANLPTWIEILRDKHTLRRWGALCAEVTDRIHGAEGSVDDLVAEVSRQMFELCEREHRSSEKTMREVVIEVQDKYLDKFVRGVKHRVGPMTGFNYLDNILPGLGAGQLIVLAARPRTGKSAMMMQMAEHIALVEKTAVGLISLEMSASSLGAREIFQRAGADITKFMNGFMSDADVQKLVNSAASLSALKLYIDESSRMSIEELEIRARRMVRRYGLGVLFVDYFQLLYVRNRNRHWSKSDELAECSMRLKGLAKELKIPIVLCAQMNREIERETHRRPRLSDLRDTGQLEQDADVIMFLWKPDVTSDQAKKRIADILTRVPVVEEWRLPTTWKKNLSMVLCTVEKQREGRSGEDAALVFIKPWTRFVDAYRPAGEPAAPTAPADPRPPEVLGLESDTQEEGE